MENSKKDFLNLIASILLLLYFSCLVFMPYINVSFSRFEGIIRMITLPLIILLIVMLIYTILKLYKLKWKFDIYGKLSLIFLLTTVILLTIATINDI